MTGQPFVAQSNRQSDLRLDGGDPRAGGARLRTFDTGRLERQAHDELDHLVLVDELEQRRSIGLRGPAPLERCEGACAAAVGVCERHADATLSQVDPQQPAHGPPDADGTGIDAAGPGAATIRTSIRPSIVGIELTQSGQTVTRASTNASSAATSVRLPATSRIRSRAISSGRRRHYRKS
jgi:hypothetical protein